MSDEDLKLYGPTYLGLKESNVSGQEVTTATWALKLSISRPFGWWIFKGRKRVEELCVVEVVKVCLNPYRPKEQRSGLDYRVFYRVRDERRQPLYVHKILCRDHMPFAFEGDWGLVHVVGDTPTHDELLESVGIYSARAMRKRSNAT